LLKRSCLNFSVANRHFCKILIFLRVALFASDKICYCQGWSVVNGTVKGIVMGTVTSTVTSTVMSTVMSTVKGLLCDEWSLL